MRRFVVRSPRPLLLAAVAGLAGLLGLPDTGRAYTPESPEVNAMVERGIAFLEANGSGTGNYRDGAFLLVAYTHYKIRHDPNHPLAKTGIDFALEMARDVQDGVPHKEKITYEISVAILLLIDVDPVGYAAQIQALANALVSAQKPHGGFGYLHEELGDTSQTQYCVLALWTLDQADFKVPRESMEGAIRYLLRTQDPTGQWGYKGNIAPQIGAFVPQDSRKGHSLTAAGVGSVLIGGDFFGLWRSSKTVSSAVEGLPPALKEQASKEELEAKRESFDIPANTLMNFVQRTNNWFAANPYKRPNTKSWYYYYMYTMERFESFQEIANGKQEKEPEWYNRGVEELMSFQGPDGGWGTKDQAYSHSPPDIATSFAILYLIRSTKRAIGQLNEGVLAGGYALPEDTTEIRVEGTQIKGKPVATAVTDLIGLLEEEGAGSLDSGSIPEDMTLAEDPEERKKQISRLERLARGSQSWQARRVATRLLGKSDSLEVVPTLIFALSDPDPKVKIYARDGLRFISRKFDGFGMPDHPTAQEIREAVAAWQDWYAQLFPGYVFLD